jgi:hypothetical protein
MLAAMKVVKVTLSDASVSIHEEFVELMSYQ